MTNKLRYFIGNWKMFGDISSFKIINKINQFSYKSQNIFQFPMKYFNLFVMIQNLIYRVSKYITIK